jgi:hypothetical protein
MPAMGKRDFDISTSVTGDKGRDFLGNLTEGQRNNITVILDVQRTALQEIITVRRAISLEFRKHLRGERTGKETVLALGRRYGELDGELSYHYAKAFAKVSRTLTREQRKALIKLRGPDGDTGATAYLFSEPIRQEVKLTNTDHFFFPDTRPAGSANKD